MIMTETRDDLLNMGFWVDDSDSGEDLPGPQICSKEDTHPAVHLLQLARDLPCTPLICNICSQDVMASPEDIKDLMFDFS